MKSKNDKFSKVAHMDAEQDVNKRNVLEVLLKEDKTYSQDEVAEIVTKWNEKEVKPV